MKPYLRRLMACSAGLALLWAAQSPTASFAQSDSLPPPGQVVSPVPSYSAQQLDQLVAPIALYPDGLLGQILMASTYPLEIVSATRWVQDPNNAGLKGEPLFSALDQKDWDPSVKALVPFPQVLRMMDDKLDWTQSLGNAFLAQQADVMDSVQRLRAQAQRVGSLRSTPQETISIQDDSIVIEPADAERVYVPYYDPRYAYGSWGYPDYPPYYFAPPPSYGYVSGPGIYFGVGFAFGGGLWGWNRWDWRRHDLHVDADRYNRINRYGIEHNNRASFSGNNWQHDSAHRRGVPYASPAVQQRYPRAGAAGADTRRNFRGIETQGGRGFSGQAADGQGRPQVQASPQQAGPHAIMQHNARPAPLALGAAAPRPAAQRPVAPAFMSVGRGADVRVQSERGQSSRQSMPQAAAPQRSAPAAPQGRSDGGSHGGSQGGSHSGSQRDGGQRDGGQRDGGQRGGGNDKHGH